MASGGVGGGTGRAPRTAEQMTEAWRQNPANWYRSNRPDALIAPPGHIVQYVPATGQYIFKNILTGSGIPGQGATVPKPGTGGGGTTTPPPSTPPTSTTPTTPAPATPGRQQPSWMQNGYTPAFAQYVDQQTGVLDLARLKEAIRNGTYAPLAGTPASSAGQPQVTTPAQPGTPSFTDYVKQMGAR